MKKTYITPQCIIYPLPSSVLMTKISDTEVEGDNGSWSKEFGGIIIDDGAEEEKSFGWE